MNNIIKRISITAVMIALIVAFMPALGGTSHAASIKLNKKTVYLAKGKTVKLKVKGTKAKVKWKSSNKKIATVSKSGKVKGKKTGKCTITAKVKGKKLKCKVYVETPAKNNARKLRNLILKKKGQKIEMQIDEDDGETTETVTISANKKNTKLEFSYGNSSLLTVDIFNVNMEYDLMKGKSGTVKFGRYDGGNNEIGREYEGTVTKKFARSGQGITVKKVLDYDQEEEQDYDIVEHEVAPTAEHQKTMCGALGESFEMFDILLKKNKTGVTMYKLGFTNWKK